MGRKSSMISRAWSEAGVCAWNVNEGKSKKTKKQKQEVLLEPFHLHSTETRIGFLHQYPAYFLWPSSLISSSIWAHFLWPLTNLSRYSSNKTTQSRVVGKLRCEILAYQENCTAPPCVVRKLSERETYTRLCLPWLSSSTISQNLLLHPFLSGVTEKQVASLRFAPSWPPHSVLWVLSGEAGGDSSGGLNEMRWGGEGSWGCHPLRVEHAN